MGILQSVTNQQQGVSPRFLHSRQKRIQIGILFAAAMAITWCVPVALLKSSVARRHLIDGYVRSRAMAIISAIGRAVLSATISLRIGLPASKASFTGLRPSIWFSGLIFFLRYAATAESSCRKQLSCRVRHTAAIAQSASRRAHVALSLPKPPQLPTNPIFRLVNLLFFGR